jgi:hypothetical protein
MMVPTAMHPITIPTSAPATNIDDPPAASSGLPMLPSTELCEFDAANVETETEAAAIGDADLGRL